MASGVKTRAAVKRPAETSTYGTAATNPTNLVPFVSEGLTNQPVLDVDQALVGQSAMGESEIVGWNPGGPLSTSLWFEGLEYLFLAALGFENPSVYSGGVFGAGTGGSPAPDDSPAAAYIHLFECDDELHREAWQAGERTASSGGATDPTYWTASDQKVRSLSLGIDKPVPVDYVHHFFECMVRKATFTFSQQKMSADWDFVPWKLDKTAALNRDNWALGERDRALFTGLSVTVGAIGASVGTTYAVQEASIELDNGLDEGPFLSGTAYRDEPRRGDAGRVVTGKLKLARYLASTWEDWMAGDTDLQIVLTCTGNVIAGSSESFEIKFILPAVKIVKADFPVAGPGVISGDIEFKAYKPASTQAWLTTLLGGITQVKGNEFLVRMINTRGACFSRDRQAAGITLP